MFDSIMQGTHSRDFRQCFVCASRIQVNTGRASQVDLMLPIVVGFLHPVTHTLAELGKGVGTMLGQYAVHRFMAHDLGQIVDAL
ncbi:hypothetical protein XcvCFBP7112P_00735 [Xanthomonas citri pv. vignicola]|nr:hypothetical protein XcvCFBP7112P_00735 [Xanthomonas citri pv. vignicola]